MLRQCLSPRAQQVLRDSLLLTHSTPREIAAAAAARFDKCIHEEADLIYLHASHAKLAASHSITPSTVLVTSHSTPSCLIQIFTDPSKLCCPAVQLGSSWL